MVLVDHVLRFPFLSNAPVVKKFRDDSVIFPPFPPSLCGVW